MLQAVAAIDTSYSADSAQGLLHLRGQFLDNRSETVGLPSEATSSRSSLLEILLDNSVVRAQLVPLIFKMGVSNVQNLAVATNRAWDALLMDTVSTHSLFHVFRFSNRIYSVCGISTLPPSDTTKVLTGFSSF